MTPEIRPIGAVQGIQITVLFEEPSTEFRQTGFTETFALHFIGDMPETKRGVVRVATSQFGVHAPDMLAQGGSAPAKVVAVHRPFPVPFPVDTQAFGMLLGQPERERPARGRERCAKGFRRQPIHNLVEPVKFKYTRLGFELRPGKHPDAEGIAAGLVHEPKILLDNGGLVQPLIRVIVAAMEQAKFATGHRWGGGFT